MRELGDLLEFVNGGLRFVMFLRRRYKQEEGISMPPPPFMLMVNLEVSVQLCGVEVCLQDERMDAGASSSRVWCHWWLGAFVGCNAHSSCSACCGGEESCEV